MTDQLADGFFLSKTASMGAQNILAQCLPTDQPVLFSLSDGREKAGGGVEGGVVVGERAGSGSLRSGRLSGRVMIDTRAKRRREAERASTH